MTEFCSREYILYVIFKCTQFAYLLMKWFGVVNVQDALVFETFVNVCLRCFSIDFCKTAMSESYFYQ